MHLAAPTTSFECTIAEGLAHIVLTRPDRGNPIDDIFCREFNLGMAELSERDDARAVLISARGRLFSVGGDLAALAEAGEALPRTIKQWTKTELHAKHDRSDGPDDMRLWWWRWGGRATSACG